MGSGGSSALGLTIRLQHPASEVVGARGLVPYLYLVLDLRWLALSKEKLGSYRLPG